MFQKIANALSVEVEGTYLTKAAKLDFSGAVKEGMEADALKKQVCLALSKKGKAYGVYGEQKLLLL